MVFLLRATKKVFNLHLTPADKGEIAIFQESTAPKALSVSLCASLNPIAPPIFIPS